MRAGSRTGFVEWADPPHGLAFWWSEEGEEATRVEIALEEVDEGTRLTVVESRPLGAARRRGQRPPPAISASGAGHA